MMKTQQELQLHYWGPLYDMVKEYNAKNGCDVKPWECVRYCDMGTLMNTHPQLSELGNYEFAITILYDDKNKEHRPVFVGDTLYFDECGDSKYTVEENGYSVHGEYIHGYDWRRNDLSSWSWNPPTPKRTFKLNDVELPCPEREDEGYQLSMWNRNYYFKTAEDRELVKSELLKLLTAARDKE